MYTIIKRMLFLMPAEKAHHLTVSFLDMLSGIPLIKNLWSSIYHFEHTNLETTFCGLRFKNPIGLAAGFDKNGDHINALASLGFGFIEVGTVTPLPQPGNPLPRLFRLPKDKAIINRMGFNNKGVDHLVKNLRSGKPKDLIIGGNIGKNKETPNDLAWKDYLICFEKLYDHVDYFVVNLSSPNTPGLRELQEKKPLKKILNTLLQARSKRTVIKPILLKISPDISQDLLDDILDIVAALNLDGIIATNTTISRSDLLTPTDVLEDIGNGGLSGMPLQKKSDMVLRQIHKKSPTLPIIGVGGIISSTEAISKLQNGAGLIQIYSGLVYGGPFLIKQIKKSIVGQSSK